MVGSGYHEKPREDSDLQKKELLIYNFLKMQIVIEMKMILGIDNVNDIEKLRH